MAMNLLASVISSAPAHTKGMVYVCVFFLHFAGLNALDLNRLKRKRKSKSVWADVNYARNQAPFSKRC